MLALKDALLFPGNIHLFLYPVSFFSSLSELCVPLIQSLWAAPNSERDVS